MAEDSISPCRALHGIKHLSASVSLWSPSPSTCNHDTSTSTSDTISTTSDDTKPIIILFAWMAAPLPHLRRHALHYHNIHPTAQTYIVSNDIVDFIYRSRSVQEKGLMPLVEAVAEKNVHLVAVQLFSNGGVYRFTSFADLYGRVTGKVVPIPDLVLDSSPGISSFWRALAAFDRAGPRVWYLRFPFYVIVFIIVTVFVALKSLGKKDAVMKARDTLNSKEFLDQGIAKRRLYVFGKMDDLVMPEDVVEHAAEAKRMGVEVGLVKFEKSGHVGHVRMYEERYWRAVDGFWEGRGKLIGG